MVALVIYKYEFRVADENTVLLPSNARIIRVGNQRPDTITIWAIVDPKSPLRPQRFYVKGTGELLDNALPSEYLGSAEDGPYVWHVFRG